MTHTELTATLTAAAAGFDTFPPEFVVGPVCLEELRFDVSDFATTVAAAAVQEAQDRLRRAGFRGEVALAVLAATTTEFSMTFDRTTGTFELEELG